VRFFGCVSLQVAALVVVVFAEGFVPDLVGYGDCVVSLVVVEELAGFDGCYSPFFDGRF
jgi:hypothetical protein